ncbi:MAG TPA: 16S rRNA (guanine(527)-N(7))-methyltransferase RsmG [Mycobacteriales bacterium]|nr:16S rRNA (guanine(527)-N(7))-methyltransferase RsmG [Mycobacteriales bacterium]
MSPRARSRSGESSSALPEDAAAHARAASRAFGAAAPRATRYAQLLATVAIERGLIGPREAERIWTRHLFNSAVLGELVAPSASVVDVGSGAGLPGIPLALARPDLRVLLLEPMARRVEFLEECVAELALDNVSVRRGRAEDRLPTRADVVVARAVAPLAGLARLAFGLCRPDGVLLALKGAKAAEEVDELVRQGGFVAVRHTLTDAAGDAATVVEVRRAAKQGRKAP